MKVLHLVDTFEERFERDQIKIVRESTSRGLDTTVLTTVFDSDGNRRRRGYFRVWDVGLKPARIVRSPSFHLRIPPFQPVLATLPHPVLLEPYDVIHVYTVGTYAFFLGSLLSRVRKIPAVLRAELSIAWADRLSRSNFWQRMVLLPLMKFDAIYAISRAEFSRLVNLRIPKERLHLLPLGVDWKRFSETERREGVPTVGYLGRFLWVKGVHRIVPVVKRMIRDFPHTRFIFAGPLTEPNYAHSVLSQLMPYENFRYVGAIPARDFLSQVDIVLIPSLFETGSLFALEAMASGKAVIASNISPMNEYVEDRKSGFLVDSIDEVYERCKELLLDQGLRLSLGAQARARSKEFDLELMMSRLLAVYQRIARQ